MSETQRKRRLISPLGGSLLIHSLLLTALLYWGMGRFSHKDDGPNASTGSASGGSSDETTVEQDRETAASQIAERIDRGLSEGASTPVVERIKAAKANAEWLEDNSSEQAVGEIAERVRKAYGTPDRAYAPVTPPPPGAFDYRSMLQYSMERKTDDDGIERMHQNWVDKDGRTMVTTRRRITDDEGRKWIMEGTIGADGKVFESKIEDDGGLDAWDKAMETASRSSLLQKLFREAVLPVLESKRSEERPVPTPEAAPRTPPVEAKP